MIKGFLKFLSLIFILSKNHRQGQIFAFPMICLYSILMTKISPLLPHHRLLLA